MRHPGAKADIIPPRVFVINVYGMPNLIIFLS